MLKFLLAVAVIWLAFLLGQCRACSQCIDADCPAGSAPSFVKTYSGYECQCVVRR